MNFIQITPGAGSMYCGNCLRDNALVAHLRRAGHHASMVPVYLPLTLDEPDQSAGTPVFFGGINVYLQQKSPLFRWTPAFLHQVLASRPLLKWAAGKAAKTRAQDVGDLTLSMLRGEQGRQTRELDELISWLQVQPQPDVVCLSNALLAGMLRSLKARLKAPVLCMLQGEDAFLDALPKSHREPCWRELAERIREADLLVAPSRYFADLMTRRLGLPPGKVQVVHNGISLDGYGASEDPPGRETNAAPVLGYFARMCKEKGLDTLVEAYIRLRRRAPSRLLSLKIGGSCGPSDEPFVEQLQVRLGEAGVGGDVEFHKNLSRAAKLEFLRSLSIFSVPARCGEAFGLYLLEAMAAGVPVVQPRAGAFPELVESTGGGLLCEPEDPDSLAVAIEALLERPERARELGRRARDAVSRGFTAEVMAANITRLCSSIAAS